MTHEGEISQQHKADESGLVFEMHSPHFLDGLKHALGQIVEHAGEDVDRLSVARDREDRLVLTVKIRNVDWERYMIGDLVRKG